MATIQTGPGLAEQVYHAVLDEICDGALLPGTNLVQEQLAERFGVSRQPIQQAIALLKADGLIEDTGRRGVRVAPLDLALMRHHYAIRGALDGLAARCAACCAADHPARHDELRQRGQAILEAGAQAVVAEKIRDQIHHDEAFHGLLYEASGNPLLLRTLESHWRFLRRVMADVLRHTGPSRAVWRQHAEILEAVLAGEPDRAEHCATEHVRVAADLLGRTLAHDAGATGGPVSLDDRP